jgi:SurA N-terminal domain
VSREPRTSSSVGSPARPATRRDSHLPAGRRVVEPRRHVKRQEKEQHYQRLTLIGGGIIVALVLLLLGLGWYQSYVRPYRQTVITVGNRRATMGFYINRIKELLPQFSNSDPQVVISAVPEATREQIENEFIVLQRAEQLGATVSDQEVDAQIANQLAVPVVNGAPARSAFETALTAQLDKTGLTLDQYRSQAKAQALAAKIQAQLGANYPKTGPEAKYEEILMNDLTSAQKLLDRLNAGETWESLVAEVHNSPSTGTVAQFDFQPKLQVDDKIADPLFNLTPGGHTDVVATGDGKFSIGRLIDKDDQHPISDDQIKAITPKLFSGWLDDQKKTLTVRESLSDEQKLFAMAHSGYVPSSSPSQQSAPPQIQVTPVTAPPGISTPPGGLIPPAVPPAGGTQGR